MRPLARWTIGPVVHIGMEMLLESLKLFSLAYPEFDRVVCFNHLIPESVSQLTAFSELYQQSVDDAPCVLAKPKQDYDEAIGCGWKLSPPRLRLNAHELFIDNDIVIRTRLPTIDQWLLSCNSGLISEGLARKRMFGVFDRFIQPQIRACAGLFGVPPNFSFDQEIKKYIPYLDKPLGGYDEQGLTTAIVTNMESFIMVPLTSLHIAEDHVPFPQDMPSAIHFVGGNRKVWHRGWKAYKRATIHLL